MHAYVEKSDEKKEKLSDKKSKNLKKVNLKAELRRNVITKIFDAKFVLGYYLFNLKSKIHSF